MNEYQIIKWALLLRKDCDGKSIKKNFPKKKNCKVSLPLIIYNIDQLYKISNLCIQTQQYSQYLQ